MARIAAYFANTVSRSKGSFDFTMNWAMRIIRLIKDLKDFTTTFLPCKNTPIGYPIYYSVFDVENTLMIITVSDRHGRSASYEDRDLL